MPVTGAMDIELGKSRKSRKGNDNCCVVGCTNTYFKTPALRLYSFPNRQWETERKNKWIQAVRRINVDGTAWKPTQYARICNHHFVGGAKSEDPRNPSYIPTVFPDIYKKKIPCASEGLGSYGRLQACSSLADIRRFEKVPGNRRKILGPENMVHCKTKRRPKPKPGTTTDHLVPERSGFKHTIHVMTPDLMPGITKSEDSRGIQGDCTIDPMTVVKTELVEDEEHSVVDTNIVESFSPGGRGVLDEEYILPIVLNRERTEDYNNFNVKIGSTPATRRNTNCGNTLSMSATVKLENTH